MYIVFFYNQKKTNLSLLNVLAQLFAKALLLRQSEVFTWSLCIHVFMFVVKCAMSKEDPRFFFPVGGNVQGIRSTPICQKNRVVYRPYMDSINVA